MKRIKQEDALQG